MVISVKNAKVCQNAVHPNPYRAYKAEEVIKWKPINEGNAEAAGDTNKEFI
ncbi:hypothetical protein [Desulfitobacterium hafniense]|uniref:hypothetical protein n=1 Tax=Desulfitobacterium hafniense TaxID=49338 RepID=UPI0002DFA775|nr:hypothetical protein [Desulfitobacterium hafniense]